MLSEQFIYLGLLFYIAGYYFYIKDMFTGDTKPNLVSWFLWVLGPTIGAFLQFKDGAGLSLLPVLVGGLGPLVIVGISLWRKNGFWKITFFDLVCGALALMAILLYIITHNLSFSIIFAILSDALGFIPTYKKSWTDPGSESWGMYAASAFFNFVGVLTITHWSFPIYSFGIYLVIANIAQLVVMYRKKIFKTI